MATVMGLMGIEAFRIEGGYRSYRRYIVKQLSSYQISPRTDIIVLDGFTGVGKTEILHKLKERGHPVLDLEVLAGHRGSVFGQLGEHEKVRGQKMFDALLWEFLRSVKDVPYILVEGESKRIGNVFLPDFLYTAMQNGKHIQIEAEMPTRVRRILKITLPGQNYKGCYSLHWKRLKSIWEKNLENKLEGLLLEGKIGQFVEMILSKYYDPLYAKSQPKQRSFVHTLKADKLGEAVDSLERYLEGVPSQWYKLSPVPRLIIVSSGG